MKKALKSSPYFFEVKGQSRPLPLVIRKRRGARNMVLRFQPVAEMLTLTLPWYMSTLRGIKFVESHRDWIVKQIEKQPVKIPFEEGQILPIYGKEYRIAHIAGRGVVHGEGDTLLVPGDVPFMHRRVREWIKKTALAILKEKVDAHTKQIGVKSKKITVRDTRSLWGSCTRAGNLSFSWRLLFAPPEVLDYLVAHEVAHLREHNHGKAFWHLVATLCPQWRQSRRWIKQHGHTLYRYG